MLKINNKYNSYYGNGTFAGVVTIVRMTDKSVFVTVEKNGVVFPEHREGISTANNYITKGLWKPIEL